MDSFAAGDQSTVQVKLFIQAGLFLTTAWFVKTDRNKKVTFFISYDQLETSSELLKSPLARITLYHQCFFYIPYNVRLAFANANQYEIIYYSFQILH